MIRQRLQTGILSKRSHITSPRFLVLGCVLHGFFHASVSKTHAAFVYEQNFDSYANGTTNLNDGSVMVGAPHMPRVLEWGPDGDRWNALWLTSNSQGNLGNFFLPDFTIPTVRIDAFSADFDLMFNTNGNSIYADGMSFNFGRFDNLNANYGGEGACILRGIPAMSSRFRGLRIGQAIRESR